MSININELRKALGHEKPEPQKNPNPVGYAIKATAAWATLTLEKKRAIEAEAKSHYSREAIEQRTQAYLEKVFAPIEEARAMTLQEKTHIGDLACHKIAQLCGLPNATMLQAWQLHAARLMIGICLHISEILVPYNAHTGTWVFIQGPPGVGKTTLFKGAEEGLRLAIISAKRLQALYEDGGASAIEPYRRRARLCIDDIGLEGVALHYGNRCNVVADLIHSRYMEEKLTFFSSNFTPSELSDKYGDAIADRLKSARLIQVSQDTSSFRG